MNVRIGGSGRIAGTAKSPQGHHGEIVEGQRESEAGKGQRKRKCRRLLVEAVEDEHAESLHSSGLRG